MKPTFDIAFESLMKSLDEANGLRWPHPKSFAFLREIIFFNEDGLISEGRSLDVFPKEMFTRALSLFNDISNDVKLMTQEELLSTLDGFDISQKKLIGEDTILVMKFGFKRYDRLVKCLSKAFSRRVEDLYDDSDVDAFYERLFNSNAKAAFTQIEEAGHHYSVFLLNEDDYSLNVIMHEMIHYLQVVHGVGLVKNPKHLRWTFRNGGYGLVSDGKAEQVFNRKELIPYIHSICYVFEEHGVETVDQALSILKKFYSRDEDGPDKYIAYCK